MALAPDFGVDLLSDDGGLDPEEDLDVVVVDDFVEDDDVFDGVDFVVEDVVVFAAGPGLAGVVLDAEVFDAV